MTKRTSLANYPDLSQQVFDIIREEILTVQWPPGSRLKVGELARRFSVSRTPIAEALNRLCTEGLVQEIPRKGYFVTKLDGEEIAQLLDARLVLELAAAERVGASAEPSQAREMRRMLTEMGRLLEDGERCFSYAGFLEKDAKFHQLIVAGLQCPPLEETCRSMHLHLNSVNLHFGAEVGYRRTLNALKEHKLIVEAFESRDLPALKAAITKHLQESARWFADVGPRHAARRQTRGGETLTQDTVWRPEKSDSW